MNTAVVRFLLLLVIVGLAADEVRAVAPGLTLAIPTGWTQTKAADGASVVLRSPLAPDADGPTRNAGASIAISVESPRAGRDGKAVLDEMLAGLRRLATEFVVVEPPTAVVIGGRTWQRASYRFATGELLWTQTVLAIADAQGTACITCSSSAERAAAWQPVFVRALAGLAP